MATIKTTIQNYTVRSDELAKRPLNEWVIRTPWRALDSIIGGLYAGKTSVIAGRPGSGKTTVLNQYRLHTLKQGKTVVSFALEMGETHLIERMIAAHLNIPIRQVIELEYRQHPQQVAKANAFLASIEDYKWHIYGSDYTDWYKLEATLLDHLNNGKVDLIDIDYVQLLSGPGLAANRVEELGQMCQRLANYAERYDCHIKYASQLSRAVEQRQDKRPQLADLRGSGEIEQAADIVEFIYREEMYTGENEGGTEIIIGKHRQGPLGTVELYFDKQRNTFYDLTDNHQRGPF